LFFHVAVLAMLAGGAMYFDFSNDLNWFKGGTFAGNEAKSGSGGAIFSSCKVSW
jgi:predicted outer membrane repeat protein